MSKDCCADSKGPSHEEKETVAESCCELHPSQSCGPARCPSCGELGKPVQRITLGALLKPGCRAQIPGQDEFCFCRTSTCDVVYFIPDKPLFCKDDLSVRVGLKEPDDPTVPACYCFGWTPQNIRAETATTGKSSAIDKIKTQVKAGNCYCEVTNPQGSCCLGNVSKAVKEAVSVLNKK